ncbi:MAG: ATP phosphoribosyltransferase [Chloroflexi bacterium]|nr:ATP phosphoribosyltransferase [Chloroflexota bacterium]
MLRFAVPSSGSLHDPALDFLKACGIGVSRPNPRRYTAEIPSLPGVVVHFQRQADIPLQIEEGMADVGIVGRDGFLERRREGGEGEIIIERLGFAQSELALQVPDSWVDVTSMADLADLAIEFRQQGTQLQVATKYPRLTERFLLANGVNFVTLIPSSGALESGPAMGSADIIADISSTGTTMRANRLKTIQGGTVVRSEACLIGNRRRIADDPGKLGPAMALVEHIEAYRNSRNFYSVTANVRGKDQESVAQDVLEYADIAGLRGPTIAKVHTIDETASWYAVTVIVEKTRLLDAVNRLREIGGVSVTVTQPSYMFHSKSEAAERLTKGS